MSATTDIRPSAPVPPPTTRAERRAREKAAQVAASKRARKAQKRAAKSSVSRFGVGEPVRYRGADAVGFSGGTVVDVSGHHVTVEFAAGVDMMFDGRDPGLQKATLA